MMEWPSEWEPSEAWGSFAVCARAQIFRSSLKAGLVILNTTDDTIILGIFLPRSFYFLSSARTAPEPGHSRLIDPGHKPHKGKGRVTLTSAFQNPGLQPSEVQVFGFVSASYKKLGLALAVPPYYRRLALGLAG